MSERKVIQSSHLALRFYKWAGWSEETLKPYLIRGRVVDIWPDQEQRDYWFLDHTQHSQLDMERLYNDHKPQVFHWKGHELEGDEAVAYMKRMNW